MSLPLYVAETRYYRRVLGISWEFGQRLRKLGVLTPDAVLEGERFPTNADASPESFGFITSQLGRKTFETTTRFPGNALTIWDAVKNETEITLASRVRS